MTAPQTQRVILVTGPSGAGRSSAINVLEDLGFEAIDNIPLRLVPRLLDGTPSGAPLALGIDARNRDFTPQGFLDLHKDLADAPGITPEVLYLDCRQDVLLRRFSETRRRHPLAPMKSPSDGVALEATLLSGVRTIADYYVDTSDLTPHDLRDRMRDWFVADEAQTLSVAVRSFSYKQGLPQGVDMVLDCRFLNNPHWQEELRKKTGQDPAVAAYVQADTKYDGFLSRSMDLITTLLPAYQNEGKSHFSIGFGCTGGQHRSVAVAETVALGLAQLGWRVSIRHLEMERRGLIAPSGGVDLTSGVRPT
ncbi:RNase adapter RapZ [Pseudoprimorskyibacter insulae]|uniref:Nucleotide-binding protein n=1 Tax=Pseudoprimorskyibacter insulae TaxID=1695997 RepID=A0A2R8ANX7_9RHOB|nr:RNase adapter RapZ [Pseudoprimorskyibacter insulae]SPF77715.1 Nucleotide-binding protein [Pseudoprimorskyibacter insulae]